MIIERKEKITILRIERILTDAFIENLHLELLRLHYDEKCKVLIVTGEEKNFCFGVDLNKFLSPNKENPLGHEWSSLSRFKKPIIMAIEGFCLGGGLELAMMGDLIVAHPEATFGQPEIKMGLIPGLGGTQNLFNQIGIFKTFEICLGGNFSAQDFKELGLVNRLAENPLAAAITWAEEIISLPQSALLLMKNLLQLVKRNKLTKGLVFEREIFYNLLGSDESKDLIKKFLKK